MNGAIVYHDYIREFEMTQVGPFYKDVIPYQLYPHFAVPFSTKKSVPTTVTPHIGDASKETFRELPPPWRTKSFFLHYIVLQHETLRISNQIGFTAAASLEEPHIPILADI